MSTTALCVHSVSTVGIITTLGFLLTRLREVANSLKIAYDTCHVVDIFASAMWTFLQIALIDMSTLVADGVGNVKCEVVASLLCRYTQELTILRLGKVLVEVHV